MTINMTYPEFMKANIDQWRKEKTDSKGENKYIIDETSFIRLYRSYYELEFIGDEFYTKDGRMSYQKIGQDIHDAVKWFIRTNTDSVVTRIQKSLFRECYNEREIEKNKIHTLTNTLIVKDGIIKVIDKKTSATRLNVNYLENPKKPVNFLKFLNELLSEKDIIVLQEYLGLCFVPNTITQKGLFINGSSGSGKSEIIGKVVIDIFKNSYTGGDLIKMLDDRFGLSGIINKLVLYDDDLSDGYLNDSANFKKLISGGIVQSEKKYKDYVLVEAFCRFIALGNHMVRIKSFADVRAIKRRVLILQTKIPSDNRKEIKGLYEKYIKPELDQIFMWALEGLQRLQKNEWKFSYENEMEQKVEKILLENVTRSSYDLISQFMQDNDYIIFDGEHEENTNNLYKAYAMWTLNNKADNVYKSVFEKTLSSVSADLGIQKSEGVYKNGIKIGRGYKGIRINKDNINVEWD